MYNISFTACNFQGIHKKTSYYLGYSQKDQLLVYAKLSLKAKKIFEEIVERYITGESLMYKGKFQQKRGDRRNPEKKY